MTYAHSQLQIYDNFLQQVKEERKGRRMYKVGYVFKLASYIEDKLNVDVVYDDIKKRIGVDQLYYPYPSFFLTHDHFLFLFVLMLQGRELVELLILEIMGLGDAVLCVRKHSYLYNNIQVAKPG